MTQDILNQYTALRSQLQNEQAELRSRLTAIEAVLSGSVAIPLAAVEAKAIVRRKRRMSAAGRTVVRAKKASQTAPKPAGISRKPISAAARARMAAAAKARWAKAKKAGKTRL